jgi:[glutamine synthetase] adenylyltransferase / [glutamine synthetase]-adenylyl-L-tyrosine phosphorylase
MAKPGGEGQAKDGPGRLQDIDLMAQMAALMSQSAARATVAQLDAGVQAGILSAQEAGILRHAADLCWQMQAGMRLLAVMDWREAGQGARAFLGDTAALQQAGAAAAAVIDRVMEGRTDGHG